ncbi:MAG TPA: tetratricopeptide repeat protein [Nitrospirota bacterium]|nr:tetratricopeptide repeat protein [Nitrospirota bacterium]
MAIDRNAIIKEAQKFAAKGQFDKSIAEWKKIAKESPNDANIFNTIGDLCLKKNSKPEAVEAYQKAADILAADGFSSKAIALYKKVLNIDPKKIEAHLALGDLNAEKGLTGNALESYKIVAGHYTQNNDKEKALGIYRKMADLNSSNIAFRIKLADMYAKEGMKKEAVDAYLQAADVHVSKDAFNEARQLFEKALALDPNNKDVYHKAGLVYYKEGKFVEACKALKPAFESDPSNAELAERYLDALAKAGRGAEAAEVYEKLLAKEPGRGDLREKLYQLYIAQKDYGKAFVEVSSLANMRIESKDLDAAEEILKRFISEAPRTVDGRRALSALYKTIGRHDAAAEQLVLAGQILIEDGGNEEAKDVLARSLELVPDHGEAKRLLKQLQPQPEPEPAPASPVVKEAAPAAAAPEAAEWVPPAAPATPAMPEAEDPAIIEALTEVDVLVKYGLSKKALEQLEGMAKGYPESAQVRIKLRDLYADIGNMSKAVTHMLALADLYAKQGRQDQVDEILHAAASMAPSHPELKARLATEAAEAPAGLQDFAATNQAGAGISEEAVPVTEQPAENPADFETGSGGEEIAFPAPSAGQDLSFDGPPQARHPEPEEITFDDPFAAPDLPVGQPFAPQEFTEKQPAADDAFAIQSGPEMLDEPVPVMPPAPAGGPQGETVDISEIWAEAEFYYQQGLFDEARRDYEKILGYAPDHAQAQARIEELKRDQEDAQEFSKLAEAVDGLEGLEALGAANAPQEEMASSVSDDEAVRQLMQEIAQLKQKSSPAREKAAPEPPKAPFVPIAREPAPPPLAQAAPVQQRTEEDFFDLGAELNDMGSISDEKPAAAAASGSGDFFDLASELRDELSSVNVPPPPSSPEDQSLDDIFEEFKRGVEQQSIKEDVDTHYNLGIAYKEMGLLDDAISEFIMTPQEEPKYVLSRYMLGLCYLEQGDYQNAITEIQNALNCAEEYGASAQDHLSMCYDLGLAFQGAGDQEHALREFQKVYAADRHYRDTAEKIAELQRGGSISLHQLKSDIEREISSKFLAEGERIEREEKTRKSEKVRS